MSALTFPPHLKLVLATHSVIVDRSPASLLEGAPRDWIDPLKNWIDADNDGVAVAYFFRQYALFLSAQFDLLVNHGGYFHCPADELQFTRSANYGYPMLETVVSSDCFRTVSDSERYEAMHFILHEQTSTLMATFREYAKVSPITLWENALSSLIWLYANVEKRNPRRAAEDVEWLMDAANWQPMRKSYMLLLLGDTSLQQAVTEPIRKTCCLYKELPAFETCTFCPSPN
ncbi:hypothetical protein [Planomicrobium sp. YIM 101495]|uniref:hypothetical protein n=1 Tax=Planomicrobium sp. YIM 101495 TaxID=2665160 RepID=UPI00351AA57D